MKIAISEAKGHLTELVRRAESGEEVILTRHGHPTVRLVPVNRDPGFESRLALIRELQASAGGRAIPGQSAAHGQDFLYDEDGLPG